MVHAAHTVMTSPVPGTAGDVLECSAHPTLTHLKGNVYKGHTEAIGLCHITDGCFQQLLLSFSSTILTALLLYIF